MTLLSEQLSATSSKYLTAPLNAQLTMFGALATQALDSASRITALNLATSHDVIERSAQTARQLIGARDARDLTVLRSHAEEQMRSLFAYSRELFGIATSAQPAMLRTVTPATLAAPAAAATEAATEAVTQATEKAIATTEQAIATAQAAAERTIDAVETVAAAPAPAPEPEPAPAAEAAPAPVAAAPVVVEMPDAAEPVEPPAAQIAPPVEPTPIAQAVANGAALAAAPLPVTAPVERRAPDAPTAASTPRRRRK